MQDPLSSAIIRGSVAPRDLLERIASDRWMHGWWRRPGVDAARWRAYADAVATHRVRGAQFAEVDEALVAWRPDADEKQWLGVSVGRIEAVVPPPMVAPRLDEVLDDDLPPDRLGDDAVAAMTDALRRAVSNAMSDGVVHLVGEVDTRAMEQLWAFERAGFDVIDGTLRFGRRIAGTDATQRVPLPDALRIREATADDADAVADQAIFAWDRYHADPMLPAAGADAYFRAAVRAACRHAGADIAWIAADAEGVLGFTAGVSDPLARDLLGLPTLTITLAATSPRARRRGVGRALAAQAIQWAAQEGYAAVEVGAQLRNIAAARTYESAGFRLLASQLTFRAWRGG